MLRQVFGSHELVKLVPQCSRQSVATLGGPVLHMHRYIVFRKRLRYRTVFFTDAEYSTARNVRFGEDIIAECPQLANVLPPGSVCQVVLEQERNE